MQRIVAHELRRAILAQRRALTDATMPVDMRKQSNGLGALATERLWENPRHDAAFFFANKDRDRIKILYWEDILFLVGWRSGNGRWPGLGPA